MQVRIVRVKSVECMVLGDDGLPTGALVDVVDLTECLLDSSLEGSIAYAEEVIDGDGSKVLAITSREA